MKERITFIHASGDGFDPQQLRIDKATLHVKALQAAREDRLTFNVQELPQEVLTENLLYLHQLTSPVDMASLETVQADSPEMGADSLLSLLAAIRLQACSWPAHLLYAFT